MPAKKELSFFTLLLLISFAAVNAVLFTPALPNIASYFMVSNNVAEHTLIWFLVGYALGQLLYGPLANRYGRKPALYQGISLQIVSSFVCVLAGKLHLFPLLIFGRFFVALGSGVGLKITFTFVNESYKPAIAAEKISYLLMAFAITPGLGVALGGILNEHFGWMSCFYASALYGMILLIFVSYLPETHSTLNLNALKVKHLIHEYGIQFRNFRLMAGGLLMGCSTSFIYAFAALAPFIAIKFMGMSSAEYGFTNMIPTIGLIAGSITSAQLAKRISLPFIIRTGILITILGVLLMITTLFLKFPAIYSLFSPMIFIYFGLSLVIANASTLAMSTVHDKAHGSAVMNFINMGMATLIVFCIGLFNPNEIILPIVFLILCFIMIIIFTLLKVSISR